MLVSHAHRMLFVHVQKTGGSSVDRLLSEHVAAVQRLQGLPGALHAKLRVALRQHPELRGYFVFGFVRNPWARLLSWHSMIVRRSEAAEANDFVAQRLAANNFWLRVASDFPDFEDFVLRGTREIPRLAVPQLDWLRAPGRDADFIGRTEHLDDDLAKALGGAGLDLGPAARLDQRNAGPSRDYRSAYTPQMRDRVAEVCADDIAAFGYEF